MAPFFKSVAIPLMDSHMCSFLASVEALHPCDQCYMQVLSPQIPITDNEYQTIQHISTVTTWSISAYDNCFLF